MKQRRKKGRHRDVNKNNPFSWGKQCFFVNKKNKKKGLGATAPKHTCRVALTPNPRKKRRTKQNTKRKGGEFEEIIFKFAQTV